MSSHYLINIFDDTILNVTSPSSSPPQSNATGGYIVRVPDDVAVASPSNLTDLLSKKYQGILAGHGLFTQVVFDDMLDGTGISTAASTGISLGSKGMNSLMDGGVLVTTPHSFTWGGAGLGPIQALVTWEVFQYVDANPATGIFQRTYTEVDANTAPITAEVSFNGGTSFITVTDKAFFFPAGAQVGSNLVLRFTHTGAATGRYFLGSWAVVL